MLQTLSHLVRCECAELLVEVESELGLDLVLQPGQPLEQERLRRRP